MVEPGESGILSLVVAKEKGRSGKDSLLVFLEGYLLIEG